MALPSGPAFLAHGFSSGNFPARDPFRGKQHSFLETYCGKTGALSSRYILVKIGALPKSPKLVVVGFPFKPKLKRRPQDFRQVIVLPTAIRFKSRPSMRRTAHMKVVSRPKSSQKWGNVLFGFHLCSKPHPQNGYQDKDDVLLGVILARNHILKMGIKKNMISFWVSF